MVDTLSTFVNSCRQLYEIWALKMKVFEFQAQVDRISQSAPRGALRIEVYSALRGALIDGRISPGAPISEPQLAEMLQTSRSPIREALGRLEAEGLVERLSTGRLRATPLDVDELEQLYLVRANIEGLAARLATPRMTMQDLNAMAAMIKRMEMLLAAGDLPGSLQAGAAFHEMIQTRCGNSPLVEMIEAVRLRIVRYRSIIAAARSNELRASEHREVLEAMFDRNPTLAELTMRRHVEASAASILESMRKADARGGWSGVVDATEASHDTLGDYS